MAQRAPSRVSRRRVLFLHGYDPRGPATYHALFARDLARFAALWGLEAEVTPARASAGGVTSWEAHAQLPDGSVTCRYDYLGWDELVAADLARASWPRIAEGLGCGLRLGAEGFFGRVLAASWRYGLVCLWPFLALLFFLLLGLALPVAAALLGRSLGGGPGAALGLLAGLPLAGALVALLLAASRGPPLHIPHALAVRCFAADYAEGRRADLRARLEVFAEHLRCCLAEEEADEVLLVGHSAGSYLAIELLALALERDPDLLRRGAGLRLVTLGGALPLVALHRRAGWYRALLRRVAGAEGLFWVEFRARWDWMNFHGYDLSRLTGGAPGPRVRSIPAVDVFEPGRLRALRFRLFRRHLQYLRASERRGRYDYFSLLCGSRPLRARLAAKEAEMAPWRRAARGGAARGAAPAPAGPARA